jgi:uncharacterized protein (DUF433 family)
MNATLLYEPEPLGQPSILPAKQRVSLQSLQLSKQVQPTGRLLEELLVKSNGEREKLLAHPRANIQFLQHKLGTCCDNIRNHVEIDVRVMHGNPVFRGSRVPLYRIVEELAGGTSLEEIEEAYPSLDKNKIQAGLDYITALLRVYDD